MPCAYRAGLNPIGCCDMLRSTRTPWASLSCTFFTPTRTALSVGDLIVSVPSHPLPSRRRHRAIARELPRVSLGSSHYQPGLAWIGTLGILFGQTELCLDIVLLGIIAIEVVIFASIGCFLFLKIQRVFKLESKCVCWLTVPTPSCG